MNNNVMIGAVNKNIATWIYSVSEIKDIDEKTGLPIFGKNKKVKIKRANRRSADNFIKSKYSYKNTGKNYFVELESSRNYGE